MNKRALSKRTPWEKNRGFCVMTTPEEVHNRSFLAVSEDCERTKMKTSSKSTVLQRSRIIRFK
jgi:hypothetical protein